MDNAAAETPKLTYSIAPVSVPVSSVQSFTLTVKNDSTASVTVQGRDSIIIGDLSQLTAGNVTLQQPASPWRIAQNAATLRIWVTQPAALQPQQSVQFLISGVQVVSQIGSASLTVLETLAGSSVYAPPLTIAIQQALTITASAIPPTVGQYQSTTLQWTTVGAAYVTIVPSTEPQYPAGTSSTKVLPAQNVSQTTYTLTGVATGGGTVSTPVTVTLASPQLAFFTATPQQNIGIADKVTLAWRTTYASQVQIQPPPGNSPFVNPSGSLVVSPSKVLPTNASQVTYALIASGFGSSATGSATITFAPLVINWFRYSDFTLKAFTVGVTNSQGYQITGTATPAVLTATGPGGPLTAQLGGTGPEVQVLLADPSTVNSGGSVQLQYLVKNVTSLILNPGGLALSFDSTGKGQITVNPTQTTTYTVVASNGSTTLSSQLQVVVTS